VRYVGIKSANRGRSPMALSRSCLCYRFSPHRTVRFCPRCQVHQLACLRRASEEAEGHRQASPTNSTRADRSWRSPGPDGPPRSGRQTRPCAPECTSAPPCRRLAPRDAWLREKSRAAGPSAKVQGRVSRRVWVVGGGRGQRADLLVSGEERADGKAAATQTLITS